MAETRSMRISRGQKDRFHLQRLALSICAPGCDGAPADEARAELGAVGWRQFFALLQWHKLAPLWSRALECTLKADDAFNAELVAALRDERRAAAAIYMGQAAALAELDARLSAGGIVYAAMKGADVRERCYEDPALRPAGDIDILVAPEQRLDAARAMTAAGYRLLADPENISHEATFTRRGINVDLHWNVLRPGRLRHDVVGEFLARRRRIGTQWGLDASDAAFLMLVHPAFAKYVSSPHAALVTVVDFVRWCRRADVNWEAVAERLDITGVNTAAWAVLVWFEMVAPPGSIAMPDDFVRRVRPGRMRQMYLMHWLRNELAARWLQRPLPIQAGLTLALHDRPQDALAAVRGILAARRECGNDPMMLLLAEGLRA